MSIYDNAYESNYEELKTYYPVWYRDVLEMDAIWRILGEELDGVQGGILTFIANSFIYKADAPTIQKLEKFLYISPDASRSLEERRKLVGSYFMGNGHIGEPEIKALTKMFCDGTCEVVLIGGTVSIHINLDIKSASILDDYYSTLRRKIPAHLGIFTDVEIEFRHGLFVASNALESNTTTIQPRPVSKREVEEQNHIGSYAAVMEHITIQPHPQPGLSFADGLHTGSAVSIGEAITVQPRPPHTRTAGDTIRTGTGAIENTTITIQTAPAIGRSAPATPFHIGGGTTENSFYVMCPIPASKRSSAAVPLHSGCGAVENTHYIIKSRR